MRLSMGLCQRMEQRMTLSQRVALLQATVSQMADTIAILRASSPNSFQECLRNLLAHLLFLAEEQKFPEEVVNGLHQLFSTGSFQQTLERFANDLTDRNPKAIDEFALLLLRENFQRDGAKRIIVPHSNDPEKLNSLQIETTTQLLFDQVFKDPEKFRRDIQTQMELARDGIASGVEAISEVGEMRIALRAYELFSPHWKVLSFLLRKVFSLNDGQGVSLLRSFLREHIVLSRLDYTLSLRIQRRFATIFKTAGKNARANTYRDAMVNSIGEFVLVSLGILTPEIFSLKYADLDEIAQAFADPDMEREDQGHVEDGEAHYELSEWMKRYYLQSQGRIFWNRWAVAGRRPTRFTDELVRSFIRETVGQCTDELLEAVQFEKVFQRCKKVNAEAHDGDARATSALLGEVLAGALQETPFHEVLQIHMRTDWYAMLKMFWSEAGE